MLSPDFSLADVSDDEMSLQSVLLESMAANLPKQLPDNRDEQQQQLSHCEARNSQPSLPVTPPNSRGESHEFESAPTAISVDNSANATVGLFARCWRCQRRVAFASNEPRCPNCCIGLSDEAIEWQGDAVGGVDESRAAPGETRGEDTADCEQLICSACMHEVVSRVQCEAGDDESEMFQCENCEFVHSREFFLVMREIPESPVSEDSCLWRIRACACGNANPIEFRLEVADSAAGRSTFCPDCLAVQAGDCVGCDCSAEAAETLAIERGDEIVVCDVCDSRVLLSQVRKALKSLESEEQDSPPLFSCDCGSGVDSQRLRLQTLPNTCLLLQECNRCQTVFCLAAWDPEHEQCAWAAWADETETRCACQELHLSAEGFSLLHPVEDDATDSRLLCESCDSQVDLREVPNQPDTVTELRKKYFGVYSTGEMGRQVRSVKVNGIEELRMGDHVEFNRALYRHHAIVFSANAATGELALIEYHGELNFVRILASCSDKANVEQTLQPYSEVANSLYKIEYHSLDCYAPRRVLRRLQTRMHEKNYSLAKNNCEHLISWGKTGESNCRQIDRFKETGRRLLGNTGMQNAMKFAKTAASSSKKAGFAVGIIADILQEAQAALRLKRNSLCRMWKGLLRVLIKSAVAGIPLLLLALTPTSLPAAAALALRLGTSLAADGIGNVVADRLVPLDEFKEAEEFED